MSAPSPRRTYPDDLGYCRHDASLLAALVTGTEAQLSAGLTRRFRIVRRLGVGGMGTVFLAEQIGVGNRLVALKVLNRRLLDNPEFLLRFQNEAASTGRIHHANVVVIHESGQADDGTPYIAMEFLEGETLREALKQRGALPVAECKEYWSLFLCGPQPGVLDRTPEHPREELPIGTPPSPRRHRLK